MIPVTLRWTGCIVGWLLTFLLVTSNGFFLSELETTNHPFSRPHVRIPNPSSSSSCSPTKRNHNVRCRGLSSSSSSSPSPEISVVSPAATIRKQSLLASIQKVKEYQTVDGEVSIDFGVKGGELNATNRVPQTINYYSISERVGKEVQNIFRLCDELSAHSPIAEPTQYLGDPEKGATLCPLHGPWKLLFSNAADATFSKNSTRGDAKVQNIVDATKGTITNVIDFIPSKKIQENDDHEKHQETTKLTPQKKKQTPPNSKNIVHQLNVIIKAIPINKSRVELQFKYAKVVLNKFILLPFWGKKRITLWIPVPGPFITRCIVFFTRIFRFGTKKGIRKVPKAYFDILYLDHQLRIHKTGDNNMFIQARESWELAKPLLSK